MRIRSAFPLPPVADTRCLGRCQKPAATGRRRTALTQVQVDLGCRLLSLKRTPQPIDLIEQRLYVVTGGCDEVMISGAS